LDKPLELKLKSFDPADKVNYAIQEIEPGRKYQVHFKTAGDTPDSFRGALKLETNYPEKPVVTVWIRGRIRKRPPQLRQRPAHEREAPAASSAKAS
jgi:hypothetical protein